MQRVQAFFILVLALTSPAVQVPAQSICVAPPLSDEQVTSIVEGERAVRTDLPARFPQYRSTVHRDGCHYVYMEFGEPARPERNKIFTLNQYGVIVDTRPGTMRCPETTLTEAELAEIVENERAGRTDLPPPFADFRTEVDRLRCLYLYTEISIPESEGTYQVFIIDPLGELMDFFRDQH